MKPIEAPKNIMMKLTRYTAKIANVPANTINIKFLSGFMIPVLYAKSNPNIVAKVNVTACMVIPPNCDSYIAEIPPSAKPFAKA